MHKKSQCLYGFEKISLVATSKYCESWNRHFSQFHAKYVNVAYRIAFEICVMLIFRRGVYITENVLLRLITAI